MLLGCTGAAPDTPSPGELRAQVTAMGITPIDAPAAGDPHQIALGAALFFDPILSGNRDQSCATCHHPSAQLGDGRSLAVGTGAVLVGGVRIPGEDHSFTPRNSPPIFNLGQETLTTMFWDRRLERADDGSFVLHDVSYEATGVVRLQLPESLDNLLAAQSILPLLIRDEMRGDAGEVDIHGEPNELATVSDDDFHGVWTLILERLLGNDAYRALLLAAYPSIPLEEQGFESIANALSAFMIDRFTMIDSPWDRFLAGDDDSLNPAQRRGAELFYGQAQCGTCHGGTLFTDQAIHNIGVRPMSRGPTLAGFVDRGAAHRSNVGPEAAYAFRTPALRNVSDTGPWMHNGSAVTLDAAIRQHLEPIRALREYEAARLAPEVQSQVHHATDILDAVEATLDPALMAPPQLSEEEITDLLAFLGALSTPRLQELEELIPEDVPSGLALVDP